MILILHFFIAKAFADFSLDQGASSSIKPGTKLFLIKASCPGTGYVYYLLSENENKVQIEDVDGIYNSGKPGYQNFTIFCTQLCVPGDIVHLSLILKRPWEDKLSVMKTIKLTVIN